MNTKPIRWMVIDDADGMWTCKATEEGALEEAKQWRDDGFNARIVPLYDCATHTGTFAGWFREIPSHMSYRLWEQGGAEQQPCDVALYE
jgi:hypothetical protein